MTDSCPHFDDITWCGICRPRTTPVPERVVVDHRFTARYPGQCEGCGGWFEEGDEIGVVDGTYYCAGCCA